MPFMCRSAVWTLAGLLALLLLSLGALAYVIASSDSKNTTVTVCQSGPPPIDFTLPLWKIPFDFVDYEMLGRRYSENDCCENETTHSRPTKSVDI